MNLMAPGHGPHKRIFTGLIAPEALVFKARGDDLSELEKLAGAGTLAGTEEILKKCVDEFARIQDFLKLNPELAPVFKNLNLA